MSDGKGKYGRAGREYVRDSSDYLQRFEYLKQEIDNKYKLQSEGGLLGSNNMAKAKAFLAAYNAVDQIRSNNILRAVNKKGGFTKFEEEGGWAYKEDFPGYQEEENNTNLKKALNFGKKLIGVDQIRDIPEADPEADSRWDELKTDLLNKRAQTNDSISRSLENIKRSPFKDALSGTPFDTSIVDEAGLHGADSINTLEERTRRQLAGEKPLYEVTREKGFAIGDNLAPSAPSAPSTEKYKTLPFSEGFKTGEKILNDQGYNVGSYDPNSATSQESSEGTTSIDNSQKVEPTKTTSSAKKEPLFAKDKHKNEGGTSHSGDIKIVKHEDGKTNKRVYKVNNRDSIYYGNPVEDDDGNVIYKYGDTVKATGDWTAYTDYNEQGVKTGQTKLNEDADNLFEWDQDEDSYNVRVEYGPSGKINDVKSKTVYYNKADIDRYQDKGIGIVDKDSFGNSLPSESWDWDENPDGPIKHQENFDENGKRHGANFTRGMSGYGKDRRLSWDFKIDGTDDLSGYYWHGERVSKGQFEVFSETGSDLGYKDFLETEGNIFYDDEDWDNYQSKFGDRYDIVDDLTAGGQIGYDKPFMSQSDKKIVEDAGGFLNMDTKELLKLDSFTATHDDEGNVLEDVPVATKILLHDNLNEVSEKMKNWKYDEWEINVDGGAINTTDYKTMMQKHHIEASLNRMAKYFESQGLNSPIKDPKYRDKFVKSLSKGKRVKEFIQLIAAYRGQSGTRARDLTDRGYHPDDYRGLNE